MEENLQTLRILIDGMHCGNCAMNVERHLNAVDGVKQASVSLASNSGKIIFDCQKTTEEEILSVFDNLDFSAEKVESNNKLKILKERKLKAKEQEKRDIASFVCSAVITILVVCACMVPGLHMEVGKFLCDLFGVQSGSLSAEAMNAHMQATNIFIMLLTIPVQFVFGFRFYKGAVASIKSGMPNMDVLVATGTTIAFLFSVYITFFDMTINDGMPYFETCCMLITFVMLGKILETKAKTQAGDAVEALIKLTPETVIVLKKDGSKVETDIEDVFPGELLLIKKGDNFPVDGEVRKGSTKVDESMLTGEAELVGKEKGDTVSAGTINLDSEVVVVAKSVGADTQLSHIIQVVEDAEATKPTIQRTADKIAGIFVPVIFLIALITFVGWLAHGALFAGSDVSLTIKNALLPSIAVICVACPCALGLATPTALMVGMGKGASMGILIKDGEMLERACKIKTCVFDKTGTLTTGVVLDSEDKTVVVENDEIKADAKEAIFKLKEMGVFSWMVSGDKKERAQEIASEVGIENENVVCEVLPTEKGDVVDEIREKLAYANSRDESENLVAFVGDGINDAPALAKADVGIAMGSGTDVAIDAGSIVLMHNRVGDVVSAIKLSKATFNKIKQNLFWALIYNCIMIPLAVFGILAPALAGAAMALSSVTVVSNSLLLKRFSA